MKNCPYCNLEIHDEAVFCVHCKSTLSSSAIEETNSAINRCPSCGNECDKNAILCVKCGSLLENKANKKKNNISFENGKLIYYINIALCGLCAVASLFSSGFSLSIFARVVGAIAVLAGLIIGKKNKIPAIGYCVSALATVIIIFFNIRYNTDWSMLIPLMASVVQPILVALLYLDNKALKKFWYIPAVLSFVINVVIFIMLYMTGNFYLNRFCYTYGASILLNIPARIVSVIGVAVTCLNAKMNWCSEENKIN